jgi:hypothetical protein
MSGDALVIVQHDELRELGIVSIGHRLTILKAIYNLKKKQDVPLEADHYVPLCKCSKLLCLIIAHDI